MNAASRRIENGLGMDRSKRRLGGNEPVSNEGRPPVASKEFYRLQDERGKTMQQEAQELVARNESKRALEVLTNRTKDEVLAQVQYLYKKAGLSNEETKAVALVTFNMGLDPSPGVGHLYAWKQGNQFCVQIGYQGWLFKARQEFEFVYHVRAMTPTEREERGVRDSEIGAVCELYETNLANRWRSMGMEPKPIIGIGTVAKNHDVPKGRDLLWVAQKRATVDAIRHLGLGFGPMSIPAIDNMEYNIEDDAYVMDVPDENAIEGEFTPAEKESTGDIQAVEPEVQPDEDLDNAPEIEIDNTPDEHETRATASDVLQLLSNIQRKALKYAKDNGMNAIVDEAEARALAIRYDGLFATTLGISKSKAQVYRKAFLNGNFSITSFTFAQTGQVKALDDWSTDEASAHVEIQMFKKFHDAAMEAEKAKANGDES